MEKRIRSVLLKLLGFESYLYFVSNIYIRLIRAGFMKKKYPELFFLKEIIKPGFVCIDIGANVGYYTTFLSRHAGMRGHVYSVEPVALFAEIFKQNTSSFALDNITLYQTALGGEKGKVTMGTPMIDGVLRHGLTRIVNDEHQGSLRTYEVPLNIPDELFSGLDRFHFLKCDVEGYEVHLFPHFMKTLGRFKPLIQVEISTPENRRQIIDLLKQTGYSPYRLSQGELRRMSDEEAIRYEEGDFYFKAPPLNGKS